MEGGQHRRSLCESEALYRFLVESSNQLIVLVGADGRFVYSSPAFVRDFGELAELPLERVHPDDRDVLSRAFAPGTVGAASTSVFRYLDGSCRYLECSATCVSFQGEPGVLAVLRDVTERKRSDEARQVLLRSLETLERVSSTIHGADDADVMLDAALSAVLEGFGCDGVWLLQMAATDAPNFRLVTQRTRPEWPSPAAPSVDLALEPRVAADLREVLVAGRVVRYGSGEGRNLAELAAVHGELRSAMTVPVRLPPDRSYLLGVHQCSYDRKWTSADAQLLEQIAARLASALRSLFVLRDLRESERKLGSAERLAGVGYWDLDLVEDRYTWSEEAGRIFGRAFEQPITRAASRDFIHPADREGVRRQSERAMAGGWPFQMEFRVQRPDGEVRIVHSHGDLLRDQSGRPRSFFGTIQDVTERRLAEDRLRESEREFRTTFELAAVGQAQADPATGRLLLVNRKLCELLGYTEAELLARSFAELTHADDRERELTLFRQMVAGEIPELVLEKRMIRKDAAEVWVRITASLIRDDEGRPLRAVAIGEDVTLRKRAEQALLESHGLLNAVIEGASDAIFVKDMTGRYRLINSAGARFLGRSVEDVLGKDDSALFSSETAKRVMAHDRRVMASGGSLTSEEIGTAAGTTRTYLSTKSVQRDEQGRPIGLIGIARDITELKHLEQQFRQAQKMEAIGRLAGGIAHDFNNLLTVINGNADLVVHDLRGQPECAELLAEIQGAGNRAANLTSQLLSFSRKQLLQPQLVNLNVLLEALWKMLLRLIARTWS
jgi:two-component system, cell cycle sensor histidine kinase and response regulator CckA